MMDSFQDKEDWARDIVDVRVHKSIGPVERRECQDAHDAGGRASGSAGQFINGQYFNKEQLQEALAKREAAYFDLLDVSKHLNRGLIGPRTKQSLPERIAKLQGIDKHHNQTKEHKLNMMHFDKELN